MLKSILESKDLNSIEAYVKQNFSWSTNKDLQKQLNAELEDTGVRVRYLQGGGTYSEKDNWKEGDGDFFKWFSKGNPSVSSSGGAFFVETKKSVLSSLPTGSINYGLYRLIYLCKYYRSNKKIKKGFFEFSLNELEAEYNSRLQVAK